MRRLLGLLLIVGVATAIGVLLHRYTGLVVVTLAGWRVDLPLWLALLGLGLLWGGVYLGFHLFFFLLGIPTSLTERWVRYQRDRAWQWTQQGLLAFFSGDYLKAQEDLVRGVRFSQWPWFNHLVAAQAAHCARDTVQRDRYWTQASARLPHPLAVQWVSASDRQSVQAYGAPIEAEKKIRATLNRRWSEDLIDIYGKIEHPQNSVLLAHAEGWLKRHPHSPGLLRTLGRLCHKEALWGKARRYFEESLFHQESPETSAALGSLLESMKKSGYSVRSLSGDG